MRGNGTISDPFLLTNFFGRFSADFHESGTVTVLTDVMKQRLTVSKARHRLVQNKGHKGNKQKNNGKKEEQQKG